MHKVGETDCPFCKQRVEVWVREDQNPHALYPTAKDRELLVHKFMRNRACYPLNYVYSAMTL